MFRPGLLTDAIAFTVATGRCDIPTNTRFLEWFTQRSILIAIAQSTIRGPELCLKVIRLVPATSLVYKAAELGKSDWVRRLLTQGQASVLDVDEPGRTPLHVSEVIP